VKHCVARNRNAAPVRCKGWCPVAHLLTLSHPGRRWNSPEQHTPGSLAAFVRGLPERTGSFRVIFEDSVAGDNGTVTTTVTPRLRLLY